MAQGGRGAEGSKEEAPRRIEGGRGTEEAPHRGGLSRILEFHMDHLRSLVACRHLVLNGKMKTYKKDCALVGSSLLTVKSVADAHIFQPEGGKDNKTKLLTNRQGFPPKINPKRESFALFIVDRREISGWRAHIATRRRKRQQNKNVNESTGISAKNVSKKIEFCFVHH